MKINSKRYNSKRIKITIKSSSSKKTLIFLESFLILCQNRKPLISVIPIFALEFDRQPIIHYITIKIQNFYRINYKKYLSFAMFETVKIQTFALISCDFSLIDLQTFFLHSCCSGWCGNMVFFYINNFYFYTLEQ